MTLKKLLRGNTLAIAGLVCLFSGFASAQDDTGIIRITDLPNAATQYQVLPINCDEVFRGQSCDDSCVPDACFNTGAGSQNCNTGLFGGCMNDLGNGTCRNGNCPNCRSGNCPNCQNGTCQNGNCRHCRGGHGYPGYGCHSETPILTWLGFCQPNYGCPNGSECNGCGSCRGKLSMSARRLLAWIDPCSGTCTYSPMHGFTPPTKRPYFRQPVSYQHNYPASWVGGTPGAQQGYHPAVYTPTDTTQLGYYYQKVPTWVPVPGMIPPAPQPAEWHNYGSVNLGYAPCQVAPATESGTPEPTEVEENNDVAPVPPEPVAVDRVNLERSTNRPLLLPILDTAK